MSAAGKSNGHKPPPAELFAVDEIDKGHIPGLGHVVLRSAVLGEMWGHTNTETDAERQEFGLRLLAASITINGEQISYQDLRRVSFSKINLLLALLPEIQRINGMGAAAAAEIETPRKNAAGVGDGEA